MLYYIKDNKMFYKSKTLNNNIEYDNIIEKNFEDGVFENGEIIEYKNSQLYFNKQKNIDLYNNEIQIINNQFDEKIKKITSEYTEEEKRTFDLKLKEAQKVLDGGSSPFLEGLLIEGEKLEDLVAKIMTNSQNYQTAYAMFEKELREKTKAIKDKYGI